MISRPNGDCTGWLPPAAAGRSELSRDAIERPGGTSRAPVPTGSWSKAGPRSAMSDGWAAPAWTSAGAAEGLPEREANGSVRGVSVLPNRPGEKIWLGRVGDLPAVCCICCKSRRAFLGESPKCRTLYCTSKRLGRGDQRVGGRQVVFFHRLAGSAKQIVGLRTIVPRRRLRLVRLQQRRDADKQVGRARQGTGDGEARRQAPSNRDPAGKCSCGRFQHDSPFETRKTPFERNASPAGNPLGDTRIVNPKSFCAPVTFRNPSHRGGQRTASRTATMTGSFDERFWKSSRRERLNTWTRSFGQGHFCTNRPSTRETGVAEWPIGERGSPQKDAKKPHRASLGGCNGRSAAPKCAISPSEKRSTRPTNGDARQAGGVFP